MEERAEERAMAAPDHHFRLVCRVEGVRERSSSLSVAREKKGGWMRDSAALQMREGELS